MPPERRRVPVTEDDRRLLASWTAACAARVLEVYEAWAPGDARPRDAIAGARAFAHAEARPGQLRPLVWAALAAARDVPEPAAAAAARAAAAAAGAPFIHPIATPNMSKHALASAAYAALALELSAGDGARGADEEIGWAIEHVPPPVREIVRAMPARRPGRGRLDVLLYELDAGLRR